MRTFWFALIVAVVAVVSPLLACATPFVAIAAVAVRTLPLRSALAAVLLSWFVNQTIGFAYLHYPHLPATYGLGIGIGCSAVAATLVAARIGPAVPAFAVAFAVYEVTQYAFALAFGGVETFAPPIVAQIFGVDLVGAALLLIVRLVLLRDARSQLAPR